MCVRFLIPSLYLARRCAFGESRCMKSESEMEVEDHASIVLVPFVCLTKMSQRIWIWLSSVSLTRDGTATRQWFLGVQPVKYWRPLWQYTPFLYVLAIAYSLRLVCIFKFRVWFCFFTLRYLFIAWAGKLWRQFKFSSSQFKFDSSGDTDPRSGCCSTLLCTLKKLSVFV